MLISHDTPFLYRFRSTKSADGGLRVYGPNQFAKVLQSYAANEECEARPADRPENDWRRISEWAEHYEPPSLTDRQAARLTTLGVGHEPNLTRDRADQLIREAEGELPPTKALRAKADAAGVTVAPEDTRRSLEAKVDEKQRLAEVARLRQFGADVLEEASWQDLSDWEHRLEVESALRAQGLSIDRDMPLEELEDTDHLLDDLRQAAAAAKRSGVHYKLEKGIGVREARVHAGALWMVADVYERLEHECDGRRGSPKKNDLKAVIERLYRRLVSGIVPLDQAEEWTQKQLGLGSGCLVFAATLFPIGAVVGIAIGVMM